MFLSNKKKIVHIAFEKPLMAYLLLDEIISFIEQYWFRKKLFFQAIFCLSSHESKFEGEKPFHFFVEKQNNKFFLKMDSVLERMYEDIEFSVSKEFPQYIVSLTGQEIFLCFDKKKKQK